MAHVLSILPRSLPPGCLVTFPIRAHHGDRTFHKRMCHRPASPYSLIFEQNQRKVYREVLIAGDITPEDNDRAYTYGGFLAPQRTPFDTAEFVYGNDTVYFAQPPMSQFVPGGSGPGAFDLSISLKGAQNVTPVLMGRSAPKSNTGVTLRCAPPAHRDVARLTDVHPC